MTDLLPTILPYAQIACQAAILFFAASFAFDIIHFLLHRLAQSRFRLLRWLAALHQAHHQFYTMQLQHDPAFTRRNLLLHHVPEFATQLAVAALGFLVFTPEATWIVLGWFTLGFAIVVALGGKDAHHQAHRTINAAHNGIAVGPAYHALHHVYPDYYFGSYHTAIDRLLGTACRLRGAKVALTGASGALGAALHKLLIADGAEVFPLTYGVDYTHDDYSRLDPILAQCDILVLAHGVKTGPTMQVNCDSFVALIERFRALHCGRIVPVEVWAVGSESEFHPSFGLRALQQYAQSKRAFARHARRYYRDRTILYRHIVPAAFRSRMGWGLLSARQVAWLTMFLIRRGFRYVPVTYTGFALVNYLKFLWWVRPASEADSPLIRHAPSAADGTSIHQLSSGAADTSTCQASSVS